MISIIVPVYNVENYLQATLDSILNSTYQDFEIILVDDGSTDGSGAICDEFAQRDPRVHVIHKANGGVSSARNTALSVAKGESVCFIDSDDLIHPQMLEILVNALNKGPYNFSICFHKKISEGDEVDTGHFLFPETEFRTLSRLDFSRKLYSQSDMGQYHVVYNKLYKRDFIEGILFSSLRIGEDVEWVHRVCLKMKQCVVVEKVLYFYIQHRSSLTHDHFNPNHLDGIRCYYMCLNQIPKEDFEFRSLCMSRLYQMMILTRYICGHSQYASDVNTLNAGIREDTKEEFKQSEISRFKKWRLMTFYYLPFTYRLFMKTCDTIAKVMN